MTLYDLVTFCRTPPEWSVSENKVLAKKMSLSFNKLWPVFVFFYFQHFVILCNNASNNVILCNNASNNEAWRHVSVIAYELIRPRLNQSSLLDITWSGLYCRNLACYTYIIQAAVKCIRVRPAWNAGHATLR